MSLGKSSQHQEIVFGEARSQASTASTDERCRFPFTGCPGVLTAGLSQIKTTHLSKPIAFVNSRPSVSPIESKACRYLSHVLVVSRFAPSRNLLASGYRVPCAARPCRFLLPAPLFRATRSRHRYQSRANVVDRFAPSRNWPANGLLARLAAYRCESRCRVQRWSLRSKTIPWGWATSTWRTSDLRYPVQRRQPFYHPPPERPCDAGPSGIFGRSACL